MLHLHLLLFPPSSKRIPKNPSQISCWCRPLTCTSASASASSSAPTTNKTLEEFLPQIQPHKNNNAAATHPLINSPECRWSSSEILTTKSNNQQNNHLKTSINTNKIFPVLKIFLSLQLQLVPKNFTIYCHQNKKKTWP